VSLLYTCGRWYGDSNVVTYNFVFQRTKVSIIYLLQIFKRYNPKCDKVKVALTGNNFMEIVVMEQEFPQAVNLLCQFQETNQNPILFFRPK